MALRLITVPLTGFSSRQRAAAACAVLLSFDCFARGSDLILAWASELMPPVSGMTGPLASCWSLTLYPSTAPRRSKTHVQDETVKVGQTANARMWLNKICRPLLRMERKSLRLIDLDPAMYLKLFAHAAVAALGHVTPHQLRHGGASADGAQMVSEAILMGRGKWADRRSVIRYMKPAVYVRRLARLSQPQRVLANDAPAQLLRTLPMMLSTE